MGDVGNFGRRYSYSRADEGTGKYGHIHYGDIHSRYTGVITNTTKVPTVKSTLNHETLLNGDIIIADASEDYNDLGKTLIIEDMNNRKLIAGLHTFNFRPYETLISSFYLYYTQSNVYKKFIYTMATGTSVLGLSKRNIENMNFKMPSDIEQQKIGDFFKKLDNLIDLHKRKCGALLQLKEAYLQNLFPSKGESVPKMRFANFDGKWEQRKLSEIGNFIRTSVDPRTTPNEKFIEYSMPAFDNGRFPEVVLGKTMQSIRLEISGDVLLINKLNIRQKRIWLVKDAQKNAVASSEFMPYVTEEVDLGFLEQLMLTNKTTRELEALSSGTSNSQKRITPSDLLKYKITVPNKKEEQVRISNLLKRLDETLIIQHRKLTHLQELKKAYLQKMYI